MIAGFPLKRRVRFTRRFRRGVVFRRHIGNRLPLRFAIDAIERLITGIGEFQKPISALLNR